MFQRTSVIATIERATHQNTEDDPDDDHSDERVLVVLVNKDRTARRNAGLGRNVEAGAVVLFGGVVSPCFSP